MATESPSSFALVTGGSLGQTPAVFHPDDRHLFKAVGSVIKVYSPSTGEVIRTLVGHKDNITGLVIPPKTPLQLLTVSLDGTVRIWDFLDEVCLKVHDVGHKVLGVSMSAEDASVAFLAVEETGHDLEVAATPMKLGKRQRPEAVQDGADERSSKRKGFRIVSFNLKLGKVDSTLIKHKGKFCGMAVRGISSFLGAARSAKQPSATYVAVISGKSLIVWDPTISSGSHKAKVTRHRHFKSLISVAIHPTQPMVATGDKYGQINLWYCLGTPEIGGDMDASSQQSATSKVVQTTLHWHAHSVSALTFTSDGAYLLSGGEEAVLVIWQLETNVKTFLPRLGAPITNISVNKTGSSYVATCDDNSFLSVDAASMTINWRIRGISLGQLKESPEISAKVGLIENSLLKCLVLNTVSTAGSLQFYDIENDRHVVELEVSSRNAVSRTNNEKMPPIRVQHACFSSDALNLATVETFVDSDGSEITTLKFWSYSVTAHQYIVNTRVETPHNASISSLIYHPKRNIVVTTSLDKTFKVWSRTTRSIDASVGREDSSQQFAWVCRSVGSYRDLPIITAAFSSDGSLLATAYSHIVTLWDPMYNTLLQTLTHHRSEPIRLLAFVPDTSFLVTCSATSLYVWNLITGGIWWCYEAKVRSLAAEKSSGRQGSRFAVSVDTSFGSSLLVFRPSSPIPVQVYRFESTEIHSIMFQQNLGYSDEGASDAIADEPTRIIVMNSRKEILRTGPSQATSAIASVLADEPKAITLESVFGETPARARKDQKKKKKQKQGNGLSANASFIDGRSLTELFDAPAHLLPPLSTLYRSFMDIVIEKEIPEPPQQSKSIEPSQSRVEDSVDEGDRHVSLTPEVNPEILENVICKPMIQFWTKLVSENAS